MRPSSLSLKMSKNTNKRILNFIKKSKTKNLKLKGKIWKSSSFVAKFMRLKMMLRDKSVLCKGETMT
jgi:23S rRNA pseudoU1915 N3-methylase RlmH